MRLLKPLRHSPHKQAILPATTFPQNRCLGTLGTPSSASPALAGRYTFQHNSQAHDADTSNSKVKIARRSSTTIPRCDIGTPQFSNLKRSSGCSISQLDPLARTACTAQHSTACTACFYCTAPSKTRHAPLASLTRPGDAVYMPYGSVEARCGGRPIPSALASALRREMCGGKK